jgi:hypothetical protein
MYIATLALIAKIIFLFLGVFFTSVNMIRAKLGLSIPPVNIVYETIGITGFVTLQWLI